MNPATAQGVVPAAAGFLPATQPLLFGAFLHNRSASTIAAAIAALLPDSMWEAGQWVNATTTYTADTADAQSAATNDFPINTITINDGHIIGADVPFGAISYDMTTATVGAALAGIIEYWNGAWTAIAATGMLIDIPRSAGSQWAAGEVVVLFDPPVDWIVGGSGTGVSQTRYNLRYRSSAAGTTAGLARRLYVGQVVDSVDGLVANGIYPTIQKYQQGIALPVWTAAVGSVWGTADGSNTLELVRS